MKKPTKKMRISIVFETEQAWTGAEWELESSDPLGFIESLDDIIQERGKNNYKTIQIPKHES